ncbi:MAG: hypothetical protein KC486_23340 [Myxococcales bacterium]|nr:hypothetical protein [Myxococcales bacterium]
MTAAASPLRLGLAALLLGLGLGACGPQAPAQEAAPAAKAPAVADAAETKDAKKVEDRFEVRVEAPETAPAGREAIAKIHVEPKSPWHMNTEFPVALKVTGPSDVEIELADQRGGDAQCFDDGCLTFAIPFTPKAEGAKELKAEVKFAVCGESACAPDTVNVDLQVEVNCDTDALC